MIDSTSIATTDLKNSVQHELEHNILPYWMDNMTDHAHGGFYGRINGNNELIDQADKGVILNTRILWTFAHAARSVKNPELIQQYVNTANRAYQYLVANFVDAENGGLYWMVNYLGEPVYTKKQVYAQAFGIYAFSEFYLATGNREALNHAIELYALLEQHSFDKKYNGYLEAFDRDWQLLADLRLSDKDANEKKTMNTHLHVLEAYTNLYRCWPDVRLKEKIRNLLTLFEQKILGSDHHLKLFFNEQWSSKSKIISFGHDIEAAWLMQEAAEVIDDAVWITRTRQLAVAITDTVLQTGMNEHGALINEIHNNGSRDTDMHWWPQAEALVGFVNAWQITNDVTYLNHAQKLWMFIQQYMLDTVGEWHWRLKDDLTIERSEDKAGPWKCPYHNGRACMEIMKRLK